MMSRMLRWTNAVFLVSLPQTGLAADSGMITMPSKYSVEVTVQRFEAAIREKSDQGWMIFTELNHAAAAEKNGLKLPARTVIVFGNPRSGTPSMQKSPTVAIDVPPKAPAQSDGKARPYWVPNQANGSWGPHSSWGAPYPVWGGPYVPYVWGGVAVPYRYYGDWGALWYPYAEWRGPHGGWGNP